MGLEREGERRKWDSHHDEESQEEEGGRGRTEERRLGGKNGLGRPLSPLSLPCHLWEGPRAITGRGEGGEEARMRGKGRTHQPRHRSPFAHTPVHKRESRIILPPSYLALPKSLLF